jgi:hypothetical protein
MAKASPGIQYGVHSRTRVMCIRLHLLRLLTLCNVSPPIQRAATRPTFSSRCGSKYAGRAIRFQFPTICATRISMPYLRCPRWRSLGPTDSAMTRISLACLPQLLLDGATGRSRRRHLNYAIAMRKGRLIGSSNINEHAEKRTDWNVACGSTTRLAARRQCGHTNALQMLMHGGKGKTCRSMARRLPANSLPTDNSSPWPFA